VAANTPLLDTRGPRRPARSRAATFAEKEDDAGMRKWFNKIRVEIAYYRALMTYPKTPRFSRWLLVIAVAYFVSPIDLIPDGIPILGQLDDLLIVPGLIYTALAFIPASVKQECRKAAANQAVVGTSLRADPHR
jgi:uncharacterized membrane protein YkvA (DUF1232 family)